MFGKWVKFRDFHFYFTELQAGPRKEGRKEKGDAGGAADPSVVFLLFSSHACIVIYFASFFFF